MFLEQEDPRDHDMADNYHRQVWGKIIRAHFTQFKVAIAT